MTPSVDPLGGGGGIPLRGHPCAIPVWGPRLGGGSGGGGVCFSGLLVMVEAAWYGSGIAVVVGSASLWLWWCWSGGCDIGFEDVLTAVVVVAACWQLLRQRRGAAAVGGCGLLWWPWWRLPGGDGGGCIVVVAAAVVAMAGVGSGCGGCCVVLAFAGVWC